MFKWMLIRKQEYNYLLKEIDLGREDLIRERNRADRIMDAYMGSHGSPPVSDLGEERVDKRQLQSDKMMEELGEVYAEETKAVEDEEEIKDKEPVNV